jgi:hypothetical protein
VNDQGIKQAKAGSKTNFEFRQLASCDSFPNARSMIRNAVRTQCAAHVTLFVANAFSGGDSSLCNPRLPLFRFQVSVLFLSVLFAGSLFAALIFLPVSAIATFLTGRSNKDELKDKHSSQFLRL